MVRAARVLRAWPIAVVLGLLTGCASQWSAEDARVVDVITERPYGRTADSPREIARVYVDESGAVFLDGNAVSMEALRVHLDALAQRSGVVWYYRDDPGHEPAPDATDTVDAVMQAIVDASVTVELLEGGFDGAVGSREP